MKMDEAKAYAAVREAMTETVAHFGIGFVRTLSCFPSSTKSEQKKAA
jgi:hypothetical protein